jgi:NAD(P)-dependent dehydrogenase (short-subunit alcohol dehydrogenase family)
MIAQQVPLRTPFTASSTTTDVLDGIDLHGKEVIVTGGHSRLGTEVTRALTAAGATVTVAARDPQRAAAAVADVEGIRFEQLDLTEPSSIDAFTARWLDSGRPLHVLINNAAVLFSPQLHRDTCGHELAFSTAHLGHFQLTRGLLPALRAAHGACVVTVTSGAARISGIRWDDLDFTTGYNPVIAYAQSKRANVLFTVELDRRYADESIRAFAVHPGVIVGTGPFTGDRLVSLRAQGLLDEAGNPIIDPEAGKKTVEQGAATILFGATSPLLDGIGGVYLKDSDVAVIDDAEQPMTPTASPQTPAPTCSTPTTPNDSGPSARTCSTRREQPAGRCKVPQVSNRADRRITVGRASHECGLHRKRRLGDDAPSPSSLQHPALPDLRKPRPRKSPVKGRQPATPGTRHTDVVAPPSSGDCLVKIIPALTS